MRNFACFSFIGAALGIGLATHILQGTSADPLPGEGPKVSIATTPLRLSAKTFRAQKIAKPVAKVKKRRHRVRPSLRETPSPSERSIAHLVSAGLGQ